MESKIGRILPLENNPRRLRYGAALLVAMSCFVLAFVPYSSQSFDGPPSRLISDRYDFGWPLPCFRLIRIPTEAWDNLWLTKTQTSVTSLAYDIIVIASLIAAAYFFFVPWSGFPEPRFSLADVFIVVSCATVGTLVWYQLCCRRFQTGAGSQGRFFVDSIAYLIVTLAAAGTLKGIFTSVSARMRRRAAVDK